MAGNVALTGTPVPFVTLPTDEGGTIHQDSVQPADLDARSGILNDDSFFQELTQFIAVTAAANGIPPMAAAVRLHGMLSSMIRDRSV